jgi:hypothetical protein
MDLGITAAADSTVPNPLPNSWLGRADSPIAPPTFVGTSPLTSVQTRNLLAQIGYDLSAWDYGKIGTNNALGRYQFGTQTLEDYGLLAPGSNAAYPNGNCVNYRNCWRQIAVKNSTNSYANYLYNLSNLREFLNSSISQEHLAYQYILDLYVKLLQNNALSSTDNAETTAGMLYVAWMLGVGQGPDSTSIAGTGAYAWRYYNIGGGSNYFNSGRYAITVLGQ